MKLELKTVLSPPVQPPVDSSSTDECVKGAVISAINIYHPGYPDTYNPLLRFLALDDGGVYYDLVYYACCIIAGNVGLETTKPGHITQAKAYLATSSSSKATPITLPSDRILREKLYFFHVSTLNNEPYPIVPTFNHWIFPHDTLPPPWASLRIYPTPPERRGIIPHAGHDATHVRDENCRISSSFCGVDQAHIIPRASDIWFRHNKMNRYSNDQSVFPEIDDLSNTILLRSDIHRLLDHKELTFFPKLDGDEYKLVIHVLSSRRQAMFEQNELYHNRQCRELYDVGREYLFARFAWSIFNSHTFRAFESKIPPIRILVHEPGALDNPPTSSVRTIRSPTEIPSILPSSTQHNTAATSASRGTKRSRSGHRTKCRQYFSVSQERVIYISDDSGDDVSGSDDIEEEESHRGRKLQRWNDFHSTSTPSLSPSLTGEYPCQLLI